MSCHRATSSTMSTLTTATSPPSCNKSVMTIDAADHITIYTKNLPCHHLYLRLSPSYAPKATLRGPILYKPRGELTMWARSRHWLCMLSQWASPCESP